MDFSRSVGSPIVLIARPIAAACASSTSAARLNDNAAASKACAWARIATGAWSSTSTKLSIGGEQTSAKPGVELGLPAQCLVEGLGQAW